MKAFMDDSDLGNIYRDYIACLNRQDWDSLPLFVHDDVIHNGNSLGIAGYREMLVRNFAEIPDLHFDIELLAADPPYLASRLEFHCSPQGRFLDLDVDGKRVSFAENVFYEFRGGKIIRVWSILDKLAIEAQLGT
jgi:predicted ester cyclase